ncbi:hypothetical protein CK203_085356 [Vitis vinifera]|uniref:Uncharacterized protein n=1 Tax=Vitis vinifera TaxID=29760 RepID=A0A438DD07_VITVI|nr:hypothetical protein CK203_085356 [Vitis vinifera]
MGACVILGCQALIWHKWKEAVTIGNASSVAVTGQPYQSSATPPLPSCPPNAIPGTVPTLQLASPPQSTSTSLIPLLDTSQPSSTSNRTTNLVKPSFFGPPSSSPLMMPPLSSAMPTAPPLHPPVTLQRPYGAPMLQPFPPPTPHHPLHLLLCQPQIMDQLSLETKSVKHF